MSLLRARCRLHFFLLVFLLAQDSLSLLPTSGLGGRRWASGSSRLAASVDLLEVRQWGVFDEAQVNLTGRPVFVVVTGETGAGKSVLMNALEYLCFGSTKRSLFRPGSETSVSLRKSGGQTTRRSYNAATRRSLCEINGQKTTVKSLTDQLAGSVRFWSADENSLCDHSAHPDGAGQDSSRLRPGFFAYIDALLGGPGAEMLEQTRTAYVEWLASHQNLQRLLLLERSQSWRTASLLTHFSSELDALEGKLRKLTVELLHTVQDLDSQGGGVQEMLLPTLDTDCAVASPRKPQHKTDEEESPEHEEEDETLMMTKPIDTKLAKSAHPFSVVTELMQMLVAINPGGQAAAQLDLRAVWKALLLADRVLTGLARATSAAFSSPSSPPSTSHPPSQMQSSHHQKMSKRNSVGEKIDISDMRQLDKSLEEHGERLLSLQAGLRSLGLCSSPDGQLEATMEEAHLALQAASASLREASRKMQAVQSSLPDVSGVLSKLGSVRAEWESIARKHGSVSPPELHRLRGEWKDDISSLATMRADLPLAQSQEDAARRRYCAVAAALSARRRDAASLLASKVNALLPSLEMADKLFFVDLLKCGGAETPDDLLEPTSPRVTAMGWDEVRLSVGRRGGGGVGEGEGFDPAQEDAIEGTPVSTLSSGEIARLSLALETCCLGEVGGERVGGESEETEGGRSARDSLVVYDEIDAHIGGEAAVAVARLLRSQGRRWQVVAITHNPVIAAAGDVHLVVKRHPLSTKSTVLQVHGESREAELARMATGRLDTSAGTDLARALLSAFEL